jgi:hypothetical protein
MSFEPAIRQEINGYRLCRKKLLEQWPDIDDETLRDTLEGITDLSDMIAEVIRSSLADQAMVSGLKERLEQMRCRLGRLEARAVKKRQLALNGLVEADIKKLTQPDFTVSVRAGTPGLMITSEADIPDGFWLAQPPKLDRQGVLQALRSGETVSGATLTNPAPTLSVRTR